MRRRSLLAVLGSTAVAGCASRSGESTTSRTTATDETATATTTEPDTTRATTADDDGPDGPAPPEDQLSFDALDLETAPKTYCIPRTGEFVDGRVTFQVQWASTATESSPAVLRSWAVNERDHEQVVDLSNLPAFGRAESDTPHAVGRPHERFTQHWETRLFLVPTANNPLVEDAPGVERDADGRWRATRLDDWSVERATLGAGEYAFGEYHVVAHPEREQPFPRSAVYEFEAGDAEMAIATWRTSEPGPTTESRFAGERVPAHRGDSTRSWYHDADETTAVFVEPDVERGTLPEQVEFVAVNRSRSVAQCGHWNLYKLVDGEWFHVTPYIHTADCRGLAPGTGKRYVLNAYHGEALPDPEYYGPGGSVGWLGGGTYAAVAGYGAGTDESAALVELVGPERSIVPTEDASATRDGDAVTVATDAHAAERESTEPAVLSLERSSGGSEPRRVIAEQVMRDRYRALRNALAVFDDDVTRVDVETSDRYAERTTGYDSKTIAFEFRGEQYEVSWELDE
ncbi:hypothetical protein G9C85_16060 [Halorubellus sp. JP-L1]|uniref:hypothetical protein n=1 Tax=Halorubellus sp. JP-L1 TaxID=2715753 RepID=UPI0014096B8B|nr:hypothetical protein [Halorubellus sp. JP-L1]NHN43133.1 hypothetical protein [Halorubellus sp. JP-L1]